METTSQILTWIELENHGWQREGDRGSRALLNAAHRILNLGEREENLLYDDTIGDYPYFTTQAGVFRYNCPNNVWKIDKILVDQDNFPSDFENEWRFDDFNDAGKDYYRVLNSKTWTYRNDNNLAHLRFNIDPGDTTTMFRRRAYRLPINISSDSVQHECPGETDVRHLKPATSALIAAVDDREKMVDAYKYIETVIKPEYQMELDGDYQGGPQFVTKRRW